MILEIFLGILSLGLGWTSFNLLRKVERLEDWVGDYAQRIQKTKTQLDDIDSTGHFKSDDEIGTIFEGIKDTVNELTKITERDV